MRITIEPTTKLGNSVETRAPKVIIETPFDDVDIFGIWSLFKSALIAYGYSEEVVKKLEIPE